MRSEWAEAGDAQRPADADALHRRRRRSVTGCWGEASQESVSSRTVRGRCFGDASQESVRGRVLADRAKARSARLRRRLHGLPRRRRVVAARQGHGDAEHGRFRTWRRARRVWRREGHAGRRQPPRQPLEERVAPCRRLDAVRRCLGDGRGVRGARRVPRFSPSSRGDLCRARLVYHGESPSPVGVDSRSDAVGRGVRL